jgi:hypothetical protein
MGLDVNRIERSARIEPTTGWGTLRKAVPGLVLTAFSVKWVRFWSSNTVEMPALLGPLFGLILPLIGLACIVGAVRGMRAMSVLRKASTSTEAAVLDRQCTTTVSEPGGVFCSYHLVVQFRVWGSPLALEATVSRKVYDAIEGEQSVNVRYADADPRIVLIEGEDGF